MNTWTPLFSSIVDSSLWEESGDVVKVFMTMIATKKADHVCEMDAYRIAKKCNFRLADGSVDELKVLDILKILASPDRRRTAPQEFEGRRIKAVEGGWLILNGEKYRQMISDEMRKARLRRAQAAFRERNPKRDNGPLFGKRGNGVSQSNRDRETRFDKAYGDGDDEKADKIAAEGLPE